MSTLKYKGYAARVESDADDHIFTGRLAGCKALGKTPQKPTSGRMMLRIDPSVHQSALVAAQLAGMSLNQWAGEVLRGAASR